MNDTVPTTKAEWAEHGEKVAGIDEYFPGWRDQLEELCEYEEEQLKSGLEGMEGALNGGDEGDETRDSLSFFIEYTKFCIEYTVNCRRQQRPTRYRRRLLK
jgi:hypothetical protein